MGNDGGLRRDRIRSRAVTSSSTTGTTTVIVPMYRNSTTLVPLADLPTLAPVAAFQSGGAAAAASPGNMIAMSGLFPVLSFAIWPYTTFLGCALLVWVGYLMLPKGIRKVYFNAYPRRYLRSKGKQPAIGQWISSNSKQKSEKREESSLRQRPTGLLRQASPVNDESFEESNILSGRSYASASALHPPSSQGASTLTGGRGKDKYYTGGATNTSESTLLGRRDFETGSSLVSSSVVESSKKAKPSPHHPSIERIPSSTILSETMKRLTSRGIRLMAHGVECDPKRVWIKLDDDTFSLSWQTEFPRKVTSQDGEVSIILMRGSIHKIALPNVLYIDVGKRTSALLRLENRNVPSTCCFSLLTQNGSLDLQTNSGLERDALVSCFSMILDQVHERDWRLMYDDGSSVVSSSVATNQYPSDFVEV